METRIGWSDTYKTKLAVEHHLHECGRKFAKYVESKDDVEVFTSMLAGLDKILNVSENNIDAVGMRARLDTWLNFSKEMTDLFLLWESYLVQANYNNMIEERLKRFKERSKSDNPRVAAAEQVVIEAQETDRLLKMIDNSPEMYVPMSHIKAVMNKIGGQDKNILLNRLIAIEVSSDTIIAKHSSAAKIGNAKGDIVNSILNIIDTYGDEQIALEHAPNNQDAVRYMIKSIKDRIIKGGV